MDLKFTIKIIVSSGVILQAENVDDIYKIDLSKQFENISIIKSKPRLWHKHLGHLNKMGRQHFKCGMITHNAVVA